MLTWITLSNIELLNYPVIIFFLWKTENEVLEMWIWRLETEKKIDKESVSIIFLDTKETFKVSYFVRENKESRYNDLYRAALETKKWLRP